VIIINIFNELTKISREPEIKITELRDILKKYAKTVSVFDEMNATCIIREDCKYMQKNIQKEYLEVYIKYFFKRIKEILNDNVNYKGNIDIVKFQNSLNLLKNQFIQYKDSSNNSKYSLILTLISFYATFIKNEPIHPVGTPFPGNLKLEKKDGEYYCPVKDKQSKNPNAVCNLCISKQKEI
jgi:uncharacterized protein (UPF0305 family)